MSIPVSASDVPERLADYGSAPYLVTTSPDGTAKVVHVSVLWDVDAEVFTCAPGGGTVDPDDDGWVVLTYDSGVLHRPAPDTPGGEAHC